MLRDVSMHARRTEAMVVSFSNPYTFKWVITRASEALASTSDAVAGLLDMAQHIGVCPSMIGSRNTAERSRPTLRTDREDGQADFLQRDDYGSAKDWMQNLTVSLLLLPVLQHGDTIPPMLLT